MSVATRFTLLATLSLLLLLCISAQPILESMIHIWTYDTSFYHCFLVFPLFFVGIFLKRQVFEIYPIRFEGVGLPFLCVGLAVMTLLYFGGFNLFSHILFVINLQLIVFISVGRHIVKKIFPLLFFLFFAVPFGTEFIVPLQNLTTTISVALLKVTAIPVTVEGINIITPQARFYVAEACAGLRFLIANIFMCYIFAFLYFQKFRSWIIFALISIVIPLLGNCFRAYLVMAIGHYSHGELAAGVDHYLYGWGFFTVLAVINLLIGDRISNNEGVIRTEQEASIPFGFYHPTLDKFFPFTHIYEKRAFLSAVIILLIPLSLDYALADINEKTLKNKSFEFPSIENILNDSKTSLSSIPVIFNFQNADIQKAYKINHGNITIQLSFYAYQNANKETTSSLNKPYNEEDRLLLKHKVIQLKNHSFNYFITGLSGGQKYITLMTYLYKDNNTYQSTPHKLVSQLQTLKNFLLTGSNQGAILVIDAPINDNQNPQEIMSNINMLLKK